MIIYNFQWEGEAESFIEECIPSEKVGRSTSYVRRWPSGILGYEQFVCVAGPSSYVERNWP